MTVASNPLALAAALSQQTRILTLGIEDGTAEIFDLVTPTTAKLLQWWFGDESRNLRNINFHDGQRRAILNAVVAHEVLDSSSLLDLYGKVCPDAIDNDGALHELSAEKHSHPKYCFKMATGTGKTWVLQALLIWQFLNRTAATSDGRDDPRFTRRFLVVAPGLIVYERLLDAFIGKETASGSRDFATSDTARYSDLFCPPQYREAVENFIRSNLCEKEEIGKKTTGNGIIAIANWHALVEAGDESEEWIADDNAESAKDEPEPQQVAKNLLPLSPGKNAGNSLEMLDRRWSRGNILAYLAGLPDMMVFNDEAHHIHAVTSRDETTEVEWQKSLLHLARGKGRRFVQVDFSATPYNESRGKKRYFPHVIVDFDLVAAMRSGLVKSLVLDKRSEFATRQLNFNSERDEHGNVSLSEGQMVMLAAGIAKLNRLKIEFGKLDPTKHPKMLVVCEDTKVTPLVSKYLTDNGMSDDDVVTVDSGKKAELGEKEWSQVRQRLFDIDRHADPSVIASVLMLREGFDVNNICVIVPLRASNAPILLEQTIGRGLRLMWREPEYEDVKSDNRQLIKDGHAPSSLIDVLSIIEHPAFIRFYDELMAAGLAVEDEEKDEPGTSVTGDLIRVDLRNGFEEFDFAIPRLLRDREEEFERLGIDVRSLRAFELQPLQTLRTLVGRGDRFISEDLETGVQFNPYRVNGVVLNVSGYNDYLARVTNRISERLNSQANSVRAKNLPYFQCDKAALATLIDEYISEGLFAEPYDPFNCEDWRVLMLRDVHEHIVQQFAEQLRINESSQFYGEPEVVYRRLSEAKSLVMRESNSINVRKCIYPKLAYPARSGGLEKAFIEWANTQTDIQAFCKINENAHHFVAIPYFDETSTRRFYFPDFMVRTAENIFFVETKQTSSMTQDLVLRKQTATKHYCDQINDLDSELRSDREWHYILLAESKFHEFRNNGASMLEMLNYLRDMRQLNPNNQIQMSF